MEFDHPYVAGRGKRSRRRSASLQRRGHQRHPENHGARVRIGQPDQALRPRGLQHDLAPVAARRVVEVLHPPELGGRHRLCGLLRYIEKCQRLERGRCGIKEKLPRNTNAVEKCKCQGGIRSIKCRGLSHYRGRDCRSRCRRFDHALGVDFMLLLSSILQQRKSRK